MMNQSRSCQTQGSESVNLRILGCHEKELAISEKLTVVYSQVRVAISGPHQSVTLAGEWDIIKISVQDLIVRCAGKILEDGS